MAKNIYEQIEEDIKTLETENKPEDQTDDDEDGKKNDSGDGGEGTEGGKQAADESGNEGNQDGTEEGTENGDGKTPPASDDGAEKTGGAKEEITPSAMARLRREKRELQARLAQAEAEAAKAKPEVAQTPVKAEENKPKEPNREEDPIGWAAWKIEKQEQELAEMREWRQKEARKQEEDAVTVEAVQELQSIIEDYKVEQPDFDAAMKHVGARYIDALRITNPDKTPKEINAMAQREFLLTAASFAQQGANPAEALYDMALERFGYAPATASAQDKPAAQKPNLKLVAENKRRSATGLGSGGSGSSAPMTLGALDSMTNGQIASLTPEQLAQLEAAS